MSLVVQKFGGTSVATAERIMAAARRALRAKQAGHQVIVVVSARGDTTDELISLAREISDQPPAREMDMLLSTGEQISIALMAMAIQSLGQPAISFTGAQIGIVTDSYHTKARIKNISTQRMRQALDEGRIVIVAGFQGIDSDYNITTLGRGGSDTTAVALAAVMKHDPDTDNGQVGCEIYTDVDGVYTTDPRVVPEARKMDFISYDEMLELASVGAGVMHSRSIEFAKKFDVPLQVRSSFSDVEGTWIVPEAEWMHEAPVCGAALVRDEARINLDGVPDEPGVSHRVFSAIADQNIVVDMIAQNVGSGGKAAIGFTVLRNELPATLAVLRPLAAELSASLHHQEEMSKVSVVGTGMRTHTGVAEKMFAALAAAQINMRMITTGDIKISVLVEKGDGVRALRAVHQAFGLDQPRRGAARSAGPGGSGVFRRKAPATVENADSALPTHPSPLTNITQHLSSMEDIVVSDVLLTTDQGRITIFDLPDEAGICSRVFQAVAAAG
ncbi:MAG TPA: aspartate kinase, partial [Gemmataceae bacterium]|nr:aspartate kinase [Gemmataceae bacterium]